MLLGFNLDMKKKLSLSSFTCTLICMKGKRINPKSIEIAENRHFHKSQKYILPQMLKFHTKFKLFGKSPKLDQLQQTPHRSINYPLILKIAFSFSNSRLQNPFLRVNWSQTSLLLNFNGT